MISQESIDRVLQAVRVEEVVGDFVRLKKRGVNLLGLCPFHNEKTPSFTVSPVKGIYKCFGCGKAGNAVGFIMDHEHLSYPESLRYLAGKYGIPIEEIQASPEAEQQKTERESLYILLAAAQRFYTENLNETEEGKTIALTYLKERQLSLKTIESFGLGWSSLQRDAFSRWAIKNSYNKEYLTRTGLSTEGNGVELMDRFRERIMFPIHNLSGRVIGFGGRIIRSNAKEAKYINSPETEVYNKSKVLYGLFQAKKAIHQQDQCIIVEGYMDVLSMVQAGIENIVASSGTSLTEDQLRLVKRFTDNIIFLFDGDAAGQKASIRAMDMALEQEMNARVVTLPAEHDPDTFSKAYDKEAIEKYIIENSRNFVQFRVFTTPEADRKDPVRRAAAVKELLQSVLLIPDPLRQAVFIKEIEKAFGVEEKVLYNELRRLLITKVRNENYPAEVDITSPPAEHQIEFRQSQSSVPQERKIIKNMLLYGEKAFEEDKSVASHLIEELDEIEWESEECKAIYNICRENIEKGEQEIHFSNLVNVEDIKIQAFVTDLLSEPHSLSMNWKKFLGRPIVSPTDNYKDEISSALGFLKLKKVMQLILQNLEDLRIATEIDQIQHLQEVHIHLNEMKKALAARFKASILF